MGDARQYLPWIAFAVAMALAPLWFDSSFALTIMSRIGIMMIFAVAYNMLLGQGGMLSFGHAVYFGMAGYFTVHFINGMQDDVIPYVPISLVPIYGALVGLALGVVIGFVSTRRAGTTFAMISLGFGEMFTAITLVLVAFFNGEEGIQTDRWVGPEPFGITYGPAIQVYYLIAVWTLVAVGLMYLLTKTPFGRISNAVRDNPERVQFVGYNTQRVRWLAFALSSFFAGLAGALYAVNYEHIGFETVSVQVSGLVLFMAYIGGIRSFLGPIIGAILITLLDAVLSDFSEAWFLYLGIIFIVTVMFAPNGLAGVLAMHEPVIRVRPALMRNLVVPYLKAIGSTLVACVGLIGLFEMFYHRNQDMLTEAEMNLFGVVTDSTSPLPWAIYIFIAAVGIVLCRLVYPGTKATWDEVMAETRAAMLR